VAIQCAIQDHQRPEDGGENDTNDLEQDAAEFFSNLLGETGHGGGLDRDAASNAKSLEAHASRQGESR
jgi:hypothetical protein